jgi:hypothetical protein
VSLFNTTHKGRLLSPVLQLQHLTTSSSLDGDNIKLATTPENAIAGTALTITAALGVGTHKLTSLSKTPDGTYEIATVPGATSFTATARGIVPSNRKDL